MRRIAQLNELKALRVDVESLKRAITHAHTLAEADRDEVKKLAVRVEELETKRGPGRSKKDAE
jgi:hypothetical protein